MLIQPLSSLFHNCFITVSSLFHQWERTLNARLSEERQKRALAEKETAALKAKFAEEEKKLTDLNKENDWLKARLAEQEKKQAVARGNITIIPFKV